MRSHASYSAQTLLCAIHIDLIEDVLATGNSSDNIRPLAPSYSVGARRKASCLTRVATEDSQAVIRVDKVKDRSGGAKSLSLRPEALTPHGKASADLHADRGPIANLSASLVDDALR
jgi:hypothetical protein